MFSSEVELVVKIKQFYISTYESHAKTDQIQPGDVICLFLNWSPP
jgi:hypothetical protein